MERLGIEPSARVPDPVSVTEFQLSVSPSNLYYGFNSTNSSLKKLGSHYTHDVTLAFYFPCRAIALLKTQVIGRLALVA